MYTNIQKHALSKFKAYMYVDTYIANAPRKAKFLDAQRRATES